MHDRRLAFGRIAVAGAIATTVTMASWPTTRFIGVNFVVSEERVPLWKKASELFERDARLRRASRQVLGGVTGSTAKAETALAWTLANIQYAPADKPVIDDHISSIIDRGYGQADQQADVFTALLTYDGVPAYWEAIGKSPNVLPLSYVFIDRRWRVFDVHRGLAFRHRSGELATPDDIVHDPALVERAALAAGIAAGLEKYLWYFRGYKVTPPPGVLRAELQMPWRRLSFELGKVMGRP